MESLSSTSANGLLLQISQWMPTTDQLGLFTVALRLAGINHDFATCTFSPSRWAWLFSFCTPTWRASPCWLQLRKSIPPLALCLLMTSPMLVGLYPHRKFAPDPYITYPPACHWFQTPTPKDALLFFNTIVKSNIFRAPYGHANPSLLPSSTLSTLFYHTRLLNTLVDLLEC